MLDIPQHKLKELVCLNSAQDKTWKDIKLESSDYIPANLDPWLYKFPEI